MITIRLLFGTVAGLFSLALGVAALIQNPKNRLNRSFAFFNLNLAAMDLAGFLFTRDVSPDAVIMTYRMVQLCLPLSAFFLLKYVQDFSGFFSAPMARKIRHSLLFCVVALVPFFPTGFVVRDIGPLSGSFYRTVGPLYPVVQSVVLAGFLSTIATVWVALRTSYGIKRHQLKFIALALSILILSFALYILNYRSGIYLLVQMASNFLLAYAIFKYDLFSFGLWMRRALILGGIYIGLVSLPLFFFFPLREWMRATGDIQWLFWYLTMILYCLLFSATPTFVSVLQHRAEQKRKKFLTDQLDIVQHAAQRLADETSSSIESVLTRISDVLQEFYWHRVKEPPDFLLLIGTDQANGKFMRIWPDRKIDEGVANDFLSVFNRELPPLLRRPFNRLDIDKPFLPKEPGMTNFSDLLSYMTQNRIEVCSPCLHGEKFCGLILFGPKQNGIFEPEELNMLQMVCSHMAAAIRKCELISKTSELSELDRYKKELISTITHEFKSPIANIKHIAGLLIDDKRSGKSVDSQIERHMSMIQGNAERLGEFIENLLQIAKIEQARKTPQLQVQDIMDIINSAVLLASPSALKKRLKITAEENDDLILKTDPEMLMQIVSNLLSNAVKFTDKGGVSISVKRNAHTFIISVKDTGRGIESRYISSLFEKFFQIPNNDESTRQGTGLGLAIAKGWTETMGGRIWVESEGLGSGSAFFVELPINEGVYEQADFHS